MRGPSGGGTRWSGTPQLLQNSDRTWSMRSQCPRAWQSGLMHCTVQPGKYCIFAPCFPARTRYKQDRSAQRGNLRRVCGECLVVSSENGQLVGAGLQGLWKIWREVVPSARESHFQYFSNYCCESVFD